MAYLSKVKLANGNIYDLKDALSRQKLMTLLGLENEAALEAFDQELGEAAWKAVETTLANDANLPTGAAVKAYVDAQVGAINKFDVVVDAAGTSAGPSLAANADNMYKLVLVPDANASAGSYIEYIVIRSGSEGAYTYAWEKIGSTEADLTGYVSKNQTIAGIELDHNITDTELKNALDLGNMAYADTASGTTAQQTISGATINYTPAGAITTTVSNTSTEMTSAGKFTPAGSITGTGDLLTGGSITVSVKDAAAMTGASLTRADYTPAGSITLTASTVSLISNVTFTKNDGGIQIEGTNSAPTINVTAPTTSVVGSVDYTAPSKAADSFTAGSFTPDAQNAAAEGIVAAMDTTDTEMLVFSAAGLTSVLGASSAFVAPSFTEGAFSAGGLTTTAADVVTQVSATADAPVFTGSKYLLDPTSSNVSVPTAATFTGDTETGLKVSAVEYYKQEIDTAEFTPTKAANLGFTGTEGNVSVTGNYDKATSAASEFTGTAATLTVNDFVVPGVTVTVQPDV